MKSDYLRKALDIIRTRKYEAETQAALNERSLYSHKDYIINDKALQKVSLEYSKSLYAGMPNEELKSKLSCLLDRRDSLMKEYGLSNDSLYPKISCTLCGDKGYIEGKVCKCVKKEVSMLMLRDSGVPYPDALLSLALGEQRRIFSFAAEFCLKYPEAKRKNILFSGYVGTGKTYLVSAIANTFINKGIHTLYTTAFELNERFSLMYFGKDNESLFKDIFKEADILIIDDLGTEPMRSFTIPYLQFLLDARAVSDKTTLITTNLDAEQLKVTYGERIFSRITDKSRYYTIDFSGDDLRRRIDGI